MGKRGFAEPFCSGCNLICGLSQCRLAVNQTRFYTSIIGACNNIYVDKYIVNFSFSTSKPPEKCPNSASIWLKESIASQNHVLGSVCWVGGDSIFWKLALWPKNRRKLKTSCSPWSSKSPQVAHRILPGLLHRLEVRTQHFRINWSQQGLVK